MANVDQVYGQGGILTPGQILPEQFPDITYFVQQYYTNQFPLLSRIQRQPVDTIQFRTRHWKYRARRYAVTGTLNATDTYSLLTFQQQVTMVGTQVGDDSTLMAGDVLEIDGGGTGYERVEVLATSTTEFAALPQLPAAATALLPAGQYNTTPGTILVKRGVDGTTASAMSAPASGQYNLATLVGNSRTGAEVFQSGFRLTPFEVFLQCQNFMYPVQVGGSDNEAKILGVNVPLFDQTRDQARTNMMYDMEFSSWFGNGEPVVQQQVVNGVPTLVNRPKQVGLFAQTNVTKVTTASATNAAQYTPTAFANDVLLPLYTQAAPPDIMFCSPQFLLGLDIWGQKAVRIAAGVTQLGTVVEAYNSTIAPGVTIISAPVLGTNPRYPVAAWFGRYENLYWRTKRAERFQLRGNRGDAVEGDWIAEGAIENRDQEKSACLLGNFTFAPPY